jgi:hypothetical protein
MASIVNNTEYTDEQVQAAVTVAEALPDFTKAEVTSYAVWAHGAEKWVCIPCTTVNESRRTLEREDCTSCGTVLVP